VEFEMLNSAVLTAGRTTEWACCEKTDTEFV
jgi:hypothetical protein